MKRKIAIIAGIVVLIFGTMAILPFLYKDKILIKVKNTLNSQVNAKVDFSDFKLSVFAQFPKVEIELQNLSIVGINEFAHDTVFSAASVSTNISLMELIGNKGLELKSIRIENPNIQFIVNKKGVANWDIVKVSESTPVTRSAPETEDAFKMKLNDIRVNNLNVLYDDQEIAMKVLVKNTNLRSSGDLVGTLTSLDLKGEAAEFIFEYDSVQYISKTRLKAETLLKVDYNKMNFAFDRGKIWINNLPLEINGSFAMPSDSMLFDLDFKS